jgi:hypothetical protein
MLCDSQNLHRTPIKLGRFTSDQDEAVKKSEISQYITADTYISFRRRAEFGAAGTSTSIRSLKSDNQHWTGGGGHGSFNDKLDRDIQNLKADVEEGTIELSTKMKALQNLEENIKSLESKIVSWATSMTCQLFFNRSSTGRHRQAERKITRRRGGVRHSSEQDRHIIRRYYVLYLTRVRKLSGADAAEKRCTEGRSR